jgi:hypothetical protein
MVEVYDEFLRQHRMLEDLAKQVKPYSLFDEVQRHSGIIKTVREYEDLFKATDQVARVQREQERALSQLMKVELLGSYNGAVAKAHREIGAEISRFLEPHRQLSSTASELTRRLHEETKRIFAPLTADRLSYAAAKAAAQIEAHKRFSGSTAWQDNLATRMAKMEFAWAAPDFIDKSAYAFGSLAHLNDVVVFDRPFASNTRKLVESKLGAVVEIIEDDIDELENRYDEAGREAALVAFPDPQYPIILRAAGFELSISAPPTPQPIANATGPAHYDDEHHAMLRNLELHLRHFISTQLLQHAGQNWVKERVPGDLVLRWEERQSQAHAAGRPIYELIHYADFADLSVLIGRKDNWSEVFKAVFQDRDGVQVALRRLSPLRNGDAHNRPFCSTEVLYLAAEAARLLSAIGVMKL